MTLASRIADLAAAIRDKFNQHAPRLIPPAGTTGQLLAKSSNADYSFGWITPPYVSTSGGTITGNLNVTGTLSQGGVNVLLASAVGVANGLAPLDGTGKIAATYLPSYVDDVLEYANLAAFPATGSAGVIYVADDTGKIYRWSGSAYINIAASPGSTDAVPEGAANKYYTDARAQAALATSLAAKADLVGGKVPLSQMDGSIPRIAAADGGMEIGNYIDFHNPTGDGVDFKARIQANGVGDITIDPTSDTAYIWATSVYMGGGAANLMFQHDGSNAYVRTTAGKGHLYLGANGANVLAIGSGGNVTLQQNGKSYGWTDASGTSPNLVCQTDNNLVLYGTGSTGGARPIFGIIMRSDTSALGINVDTTFASGTVNVRGTTMMQLIHDGANGFVRALTGTLAIGANGNNSLWCNTDGTLTTGYQFHHNAVVDISASGNQLLLKNGTDTNPTVIHRNDGGNYYILLSAAGSAAPSGAWNNLRPFTMNVATGDISMSQNLNVAGQTVSATFQTQGTGGAFTWNERDGVGNLWTAYATGGIWRLWNGSDRITVDSVGALTSVANINCRDFHADRGDGTGVIYLGNTGGRYLFYDNTNYNLPGAGLIVGGNITSSSDRRLKSDIRPLEGAREILASIGSYRFTMRDAPSLGVIAQEVEEVLPELVSTDSEGMLAVDYGKLSAVLIADNNTLAARVATLEALVGKLLAA